MICLTQIGITIKFNGNRKSILKTFQNLTAPAHEPFPQKGRQWPCRTDRVALVWLVTKKSATWWYQNKSFCLVWVACSCTLKSEPEACLLHVHDRLCYNNSEAVHAIIIAKPFNPFPATHDFRRLLFLMVFVRMLPIMRTLWTKIRIQKKTLCKTTTLKNTTNWFSRPIIA